jgi:hypothetical protein
MHRREAIFHYVRKTIYAAAKNQADNWERMTQIAAALS